jgi:hypothetical protein
MGAVRVGTLLEQNTHGSHVTTLGSFGNRGEGGGSFGPA